MKIPRITDDRVQENRLPGVSFNVRGSDFGAENAQQMDQAVQGVVKIGRDIYEREQKFADESVQLEAGARLAQFELEQNQKTREARGERAMLRSDEYEQDASKMQADLARLARNDRQKAMIGRLLLNTDSQLRNSILAHQSRENVEVYKSKTASFNELQDKIAIDNVNNPIRIAEVISNKRDSTIRLAEFLGLPKETQDVMVADSIRKTHINVINTLTSTDPNRAIEYYDANEKEIGPDFTREKLIKNIKSIEKAFEYDYKLKRSQNGMKVLTGIASGQKPTIEDMVKMGLSEEVNQELVQAYIKYETNPAFIDRHDDAGFYNYAVKLFEAKDKEGIEKAIIYALSGGKDSKIAQADLERLILAAGNVYSSTVSLENGKEEVKSVFHNSWNGFREWIDSIKVDDKQKSMAVSSWLSKANNAKKEGVSDREAFQIATEEAQKETITSIFPEVSKYKDVPNYIATKTDGIKLLFNSVTGDEFDFVYDPKTKKSVPSKKQQAENRLKSK